MDPDQIEKREFLVSLRGYARDEVEAFKSEVAEELRGLNQKLSTSAQDLAKVRSQLAETGKRLAAALAKPPAPALEAEKPAEQETVPSADRALAFKQVAQETEKILMAAEQVAEQMHERAIREAAEIVTDARRQAQRALEEVDEARRAADQDFVGIRQARSTIASQMEDIRRRLDESIGRLRMPVESVTPSLQRPLPAVSVEPSGALSSTDQLKEAERRELEQRSRERAAQAAERQAAERQAAERQAAERQAAERQPGPEDEPADMTGAPLATATGSSLDQLLEELRQKRGQEQGIDAAQGSAMPDTGRLPKGGAGPAARPEHAGGPVQPESTGAPPGLEAFPSASIAAARGAVEPPEVASRAAMLGNLPTQTARRLKRLLQEDHNDLLDRLRTRRGKGSLEENLAPFEEQRGRFEAGLQENLGRAFLVGREAGGASEESDPAEVVAKLVIRQVVKPLRSEVSAAVQAGLEAEDTASYIAERASDVFRVWKGVRTELLGEGMAYAAFHQGLVGAWSSQPDALKVWVISADEVECPNDVCHKNEAAGGVPLRSPFPSGHLVPPAHGGCTCTLKRSPA